MSSEEEIASLLESTSVQASVIVDRLTAMQRQERTPQYACSDYIGDESKYNVHICRQRHVQSVDTESRVKMIQWMYEVSDFCKFNRSTVAISVSFLDRFLSTNHPIAREAIHSMGKYQLSAMVCLYLAVKMYEQMAIDPTLLAEISKGCYTEQAIEEMEEDILMALGWRISGPVSHDFIRHMIALVPSSAYNHDETIAMALYDFTKFQAELAILDYDLSCLCCTSMIALACILNSSEGISERLLSARSRYDFLRCIADETGVDPYSVEVNEIRKRLLRLFVEHSGYELPQIAEIVPVCYDASIYQCYAEQPKNSDEDMDDIVSPTSVRSVFGEGMM
jgi:hypothetical protein